MALQNDRCRGRQGERERTASGGGPRVARKCICMQNLPRATMSDEAAGAFSNVAGGRADVTVEQQCVCGAGGGGGGGSTWPRVVPIFQIAALRAGLQWSGGPL